MRHNFTHTLKFVTGKLSFSQFWIFYFFHHLFLLHKVLHVVFPLFKMKEGRRGCERPGEVGRVRFAERFICAAHSDLQSSFWCHTIPTLHTHSSSMPQMSVSVVKTNHFVLSPGEVSVWVCNWAVTVFILKWVWAAEQGHRW